MALRQEIAAVLNCHSKDNGSNTPDWILAEYLLVCLDAFDGAVNAREKWYGRENARPATSRPTISGLEAILNAEDGPPVEILPDGTVRPVF